MEEKANKKVQTMQGPVGQGGGPVVVWEVVVVVAMAQNFGIVLRTMGGYWGLGAGEWHDLTPGLGH